jgi:hypothetical protein
MQSRSCRKTDEDKRIPSKNNRGVAIFATACLGASQPQQAAKITRPLLPAAAPIRPRHLVSTQPGVET